MLFYNFESESICVFWPVIVMSFFLTFNYVITNTCMLFFIRSHLDISSWLQRSAQDIPCTGRRLSAWATMRCCPSMRSLRSWAPNSQRLMLRFCPFSSMKPILENIPSIQRGGLKIYLQGLMDLHRVILHVLGFWRHGEEYSRRMSRAPSPVAIDPRVALNCCWSWRGEGTWARETSDLYCSCCGFWHGMMSCPLSHKRKEEQVSISFKTTVYCSSKPVMLWSDTDVSPVLLVSPEREKIDYPEVDTRRDTQISSNTDMPSFENTQDHQWRAGEQKLQLKAQHFHLLKFFFLPF